MEKCETVIAYVDGSYNNVDKCYGYSSIILLPNGRIIALYGCDDNDSFLSTRNIAGEVTAAALAIKWAVDNNYKSIAIHYDYQGICSWAMGEWKAKTIVAKSYLAAISEYRSRININFRKVKAHSGDTYNGLADKYARKGATCGEKIKYEIVRG